MGDIPSFETLPSMVFGLKQQVSELTAMVEKLVKIDPVPPPDEQRFYGDKDLAKYLNCTVQTVSRLKHAGKIPFHRYGRKYYYLRSEIDTSFKGRS
ncbi:helix-turn-helix domain-containing protein [Candidatus Nomurabacteria bacterium]|nr:helix-turn-helix domain-containing protein [Candidatus Nomurabacteria bacterium]